MNWYVLNTLSYKTNQVVFNLNKRKCIEAFVPQYEYYHRKTKEYLIKPMFTGYVFVKSDMNNEVFNKKFKEFFESIEGFGELLEYEGVYALKDAEQSLMEKLFNGGHIIKRSIGNIVDKKLIVDAGPLLGLDDLVVKINRHHRVATLQTEFFDKKIMVPLEVISKS